MKSRRWLITVSIIILLAISFFLGGTDSQNDVMPEERAVKTQAANHSVSYHILKDLQQEEDSSQTDQCAGKEDVNASGLFIKDTTKALPNKAAEPEKSIIEPEKQQEETPAQNHQDGAGLKPMQNKSQSEITNPEEGRIKPVQRQEPMSNEDKKLTCTLSVSCSTILDHMNQFDKNKMEVLPDDGIIYKAREITFSEGESVFDVLLREMKKNKIHIEFVTTPVYDSNYIEGIHNIYEFDCGQLSGWMYKVNGRFPNYGCTQYMLEDGDVVEWIYTCDLGRDIGKGTAAGGKK